MAPSLDVIWPPLQGTFPYFDDIPPTEGTGQYELSTVSIGGAPTGDMDQRAHVPMVIFGPVAAGGIAFYDGLLGLGTGAFLVLATAGLLGQNLRIATAHAKLLNFARNVGSLIFFVFGGNVVWAAGLAVAAGQLIGAWVGAKAMMAKGARLVRPLVVLTALAMAARLLI